jgi:putative NADH-flavin reductase
MATGNGTMEQGTQTKVLVFGATGTTGSAVVERALECGYAVTAFVRNPEKVTTQHPNLTVVQGDVLDPATVERAMPGHDAVVSALGAGMNGTVRSEGTRNIIRAMEQAHVPRLVAQSTLGVGESRANLNAYWKYIMFGLLLRRAYADHIQQEQYITHSHLDWTIVRPAALTQGERTGTYRHGFAGTAKDLTLEISTADVADFMVQQVEDTTYRCGTPGLSY